ncbi:hypothetical protein Q8A73_011511 [Channa argus]|nr:hypothetical protein Q8A73_011511 [Channa argus]
MCWLPIDQPLLLPGDSSCSVRRRSPCSDAQRLASRLRRIGDQLEKGWTAGETDGGFSCKDGSGEVVVERRGHFQSFLCPAIHLTVLVLFAARRHLWCLQVHVRGRYLHYKRGEHEDAVREEVHSL